MLSAKLLYDTEAEIRSYENVPLASQSKTLRTRNARNASSVGAGARYSYRDIEQGLASLQSDTDFSEECSDEESATTTNGYDTVYTSSSSEYSNDDNSEWDTDFSDDRSDKDELPTPPPEEEWAALGALVELDNTTEPTELSAYSKVSNPDEAEATDILEASDIPLSFTNQKMTKEVSVVADIKDITEDTQDESTAASVLEILDQKNTEEDNLPQDISANLRNTAIIEPQEQSTARDQEELLKKASTIASSSTQARQASKIASNHIKQRMFVRDMLVAVASGDESESDQSQILGYSVWSSGAFGSAKQKASNTLHGYRSKILGGTIGADINFENDLLVGSSFSKIRSNIKHASQKVTKKLNTYIASFYGSSLVKGNLTFGVIGSAGFSPKPRSKLLSLESHLHYKIALPQNVTLIPHIGFKYEYERSKTYQEQIGGNVSIARAKKSYQAISGEIGSRVIFAPIKLDANGTSNITLSKTTASTISITPTAHFSVERRIGSRGVNSPYHLTYQGNGGVGQEIGASTLSINPQHQKTSFNTGIGLIASLKNIKLELLYDHTRQKRFKSHQGVLKLKVNL
ncbi:autotransporter outer membrane beta-barrel domain-containing protein [Rickettsia endosymbiont of Urophora cardui]|uniref:autotransporter outer membrane beta-barrel domain-containing protein n=1 Tax=Rickettsia endosymbiont of Urophora cardui TaxID=3066265 RepID=UPI00313D28E8